MASVFYYPEMEEKHLTEGQTLMPRRIMLFGFSFLPHPIRRKIFKNFRGILFCLAIGISEGDDCPKGEY
jgi:hypothetical protein